MLLTMLARASGQDVSIEINKALGRASGINNDFDDRQMHLFMEELAPLLHIRTLLLVENNLPHVKNSFINRARENFYTDVMAFNPSQSQDNVFMVRQWMGNITQFDFQADIPPNLFFLNPRFILLNIVQLNLFWQVPSTTSEKYVFNEKQQMILFNMMNMINFFTYTQYPLFSAVDVGLCHVASTDDRCDYMMTVLLPNSTDISLEQLENNVSWESLLPNNTADRPKQLIDLWLPRFNINSSTLLIEPLRQMGISSIFNRRKGGNGERKIIADKFSRMFKSRYNTTALSVDRIAQQLQIKINPAAAKNFTKKAPFFKESSIYMNVNRPFMFIVWHTVTRWVLSVGSVRDFTEELI